MTCLDRVRPHLWEPSADSRVDSVEEMRERSDDELMECVRSGNTEAFTELVDRHKDGLVNYVAHLCGDRERAEEVAQETFVRLYRTCSRYDGKGRLAPYLYRIATNHLRSIWRREKRWRLLSAGLWQPKVSDDDPAGDLLRNEATEEVRRALAALPVHYRAALVMREIEGWSYQEIAAALGCAEGTVKSKINRGREQLRRSLTAYWNGNTVSHEL